MLEMNDIDDNMENYEDTSDSESGANELTRRMKKNATLRDGGSTNSSDGKRQERDDKSILQESSAQEVQMMELDFIFILHHRVMY